MALPAFLMRLPRKWFSSGSFETDKSSGAEAARQGEARVVTEEFPVFR
jgi:hypothetical protein